MIAGDVAVEVGRKDWCRHCRMTMQIELASDTYCRHCGSVLVSDEEAKCECGRQLKSRDAFCPGCGRKAKERR